MNHRLHAISLKTAQMLTCVLGIGERRHLSWHKFGVMLASAAALGVTYKPTHGAPMYAAKAKPVPVSLNVLRSLSLSSPVDDLLFSPDGKLLVATGDDNVIRVWDVRTWHLVRALKQPVSSEQGMQFSPDGKILAVTGNDCIIRLWDVKGWRLRVLKGVHTAHDAAIGGGDAGIYDMAISPDGMTVVAAGYGLESWDLKRGRHHTLQPLNTVFSSVIFLPNGKLIATGEGQEGVTTRVTVRDVNTGRVKWTRVPPGRAQEMGKVVVFPDGHTLATAGSDAVDLWDATTGRLREQLSSQRDFGSQDIAFSHNGKSVAVAFKHANKRGEIRFYNGRDRKVQAVAPVYGASPSGIEFSADNRVLVSLNSRNGSIPKAGKEYKDITDVRLWNARTGQLFKTLPDARSYALSPRNNLLAIADDSRTIKLWHIK